MILEKCSFKKFVKRMIKTLKNLLIFKKLL